MLHLCEKWNESKMLIKNLDIHCSVFLSLKGSLSSGTLHTKAKRQ